VSPGRRALLLNCLRCLLLGLVCFGWLAGPARAVTSVYHSPDDDGLQGSGEIPAGGMQPVYLYIDGGAVASEADSVCNDGQGDEVCGYELELTGLNGLTFILFSADIDADLLVNSGGSSIKMNGLDTQSPTPGPQRIGELLVIAAVGSELELTSGEVVGADLGSEILPTTTLVTVPEPGELLLLASGVSLLALLARRRARW
jgi:hypothetical protein